MSNINLCHKGHNFILWKCLTIKDRVVIKLNDYIIFHYLQQHIEWKWNKTASMLKAAYMGKRKQRHEQEQSSWFKPLLAHMKLLKGRKYGKSCKNIILLLSSWYCISSSCLNSLCKQVGQVLPNCKKICLKVKIWRAWISSSWVYYSREERKHRPAIALIGKKSSYRACPVLEIFSKQLYILQDTKKEIQDTSKSSFSGNILRSTLYVKSVGHISSRKTKLYTEQGENSTNPHILNHNT